MDIRGLNCVFIKGMMIAPWQLYGGASIEPVLSGTVHVIHIESQNGGATLATQTD